MLLSIVVNLLSSINGTQSAQQAASPLGPIMAAASISIDSKTTTQLISSISVV